MGNPAFRGQHDVVEEERADKVHDFPDTEHAVVVLGAGLAGVALLAGLQKVGIPAIVLEKSPELRQSGFAITLWPNAFHAMKTLGCGGPAFREQFIQNKTFDVYNPAGKLLRSVDLIEHMGVPEGAVNEQRSVDRRLLQAELASVCDPSHIYYGCTVTGIEATETGATVTLKSGQQLKAKVVVGAEGANSPTAQYLGLPTPVYKGYVDIRGLVPVAAGLKGGALQPGGHFSMVQGPGARFGVIQLTRDHVYFFLTANAEDKQVYDKEAIREEARRAVQGWAFPARDLIDACEAKDLLRSRIYDRWMPAGKPFGRGAVTLMGDALHVSSPNLGQGGCAAIEDAVELTRILRLGVGGEVGSAGAAFKAASPEIIEKALREYEAHRTKRTSAIVKKSHWMGVMGQLSFTPAIWVRDFMTGNVMSSKGFFDHCAYDCGSL